jgi:hypothetical protein
MSIYDVILARRTAYLVLHDLHSLKMVLLVYGSNTVDIYVCMSITPYVVDSPSYFRELREIEIDREREIG